MHVIVGLGTGGAEVNLHRLVREMDRSRFQNVVVSMVRPGPIANEIEKAGTPVISLDLRQGSPNPFAIFKLARFIKEWKPDLIQTWMSHADLLGGLTAKFFSDVPVVWNIRNSDSGSQKMMTSLVAHFCALTSSWLPVRIVSCSNAGRDCRTKIGYSASRIEVIFNGYDVSHFRPAPGEVNLLRKELGIQPDIKLIANIARYHPLKDHACFLSAARLIRDAESRVLFVMCGDGVTWENEDLVNKVDHLGLRDCVLLLGRRRDINLIMAASAVLVSSSISEGFPNVIAEAMACNTICVATDVGDSRDIIGGTGFVVPPSNPQALAEKVIDALHLTDNPEMKMPAGRDRVAAKFSLRSMVARYEALYEEIASNNQGSNGRKRL
jgi:glycosyltransferase involved in cell wall biosynthesis